MHISSTATASSGHRRRPERNSEAHVEDAAAADGSAASFPEAVAAAAGGLLLLVAAAVLLRRRVRRRWRDVGRLRGRAAVGLLARRWVRGAGRRVACLVAHGRWIERISCSTPLSLICWLAAGEVGVEVCSAVRGWKTMAIHAYIYIYFYTASEPATRFPRRSPAAVA